MSVPEYGEFSWVADPAGVDGDRERALLARQRGDIEILGGVVDEEASYEFDEWALIRLRGDYYLLRSSGCSCPSPSEVWGIECGPTTIAKIREKIEGGDYHGFSLPKKKLDAFLALLAEAEAKA